MALAMTSATTSSLTYCMVRRNRFPGGIGVSAPYKPCDVHACHGQSEVLWAGWVGPLGLGLGIRSYLGVKEPSLYKERGCVIQGRQEL